MKRKLFSYPSGLIMSVLLFILLSPSCTKPTIYNVPSSASDEVIVARAGKPTTLPIISLSVTVNDATGYNLTSDGGGNYVNGSQAVGAKFDQYGNFIFSCGRSGRGSNAVLVRWMSINFSSPVVVYIAQPITGNDKVTAITTIPVAAYTFTPLQNMAEGESQCVGLTGGSGADWVMNFHRGAEDISSSPSSYAVFTRINATQWTVTPVGTCSPNSNVCALRNGTSVLYGYYNMPFSFTLTKL